MICEVKIMNVFVKIFFLLMLSVSICANVFSQQNQYQISISTGNRLMGQTEKFEFGIGSQKIVVDLAYPVVAFPNKFNAGQSINVVQISGPRPCYFSQNNFLMPNQDKQISVACGTPPTSLFAFEVSGIKSGEVFRFKDSYGRFTQATYNNNFALEIPLGDSFLVSQISGPRQCVMSNNQAVSPNTNSITIRANCSQFAVTPPTNPNGNTGSPPKTVNLKLKTIGIEPKETFTFTDNLNRTTQVTGSTTTDLGDFTVGNNFYLKQEEGLRPCKLTNNRGAVSNADKNGFTITADCTKSTTNGPFNLGVSYASSLFSNKEKFEFSIANNEKVVLDGKAPAVFFNSKFIVGQSYQINQISGPRTCNLFSNRQGNFTNQDIIVMADCGTPPTTLFKFEITGVEPGETFSFADGHGRIGSSYNTSTTQNWGAFPQGDDYYIIQKSGPRQCNMTNNQGIVPNNPVTVKADCSKTGANPPINTNGNTDNTNPNNENPIVSNPYNVKWDLVSRSTDNKSLGTYYENWTPVIGGKGEDEGRYVAFVSQTAGIGGSTGKSRQIIWRDRKTGETRLVSASATGGEGNQNSLAPAISADGKSVAFESYATNLVPTDTNGARDIFVWNADKNTITAVSTGQGETEANYQSYEPTISGDGNLIAFTSNATNLIPNVMGISSYNVYLKDIRSGSIKIISFDEKTKKGGGGSNPSISEDGTRIAFYNYAPLTTEDTNNLWDIYVWMSGNPKLKRISTTAEGGNKDQGDDSSSRVVAPAISGNGKFVAYSTTATNVVGGDTNKSQDVFVVEIDSGRVSRASVGSDNAEGNGDSPIGQGEKIAISYDGNLIAFSTKATNLGGNILLRNLSNNQIIPISTETGLTVSQPVMSRNGSFVAFGTSSELDGRFKSSGIFSVFTGKQP